MLLPFAIISLSWISNYFEARATTVNPGVACDTTWNTGLIESPDGNPNSYMHCVSMGFGTLGIWKLESCLPGYTFQISEKTCVPKQPMTQMSNKFFAILNNSCANGEECIGGTICDLSSKRCMCPAGMTANVNTLSCIPVSSSFKSLQQNVYNVYSSNAHEVMLTAENNLLPNVFHSKSNGTLKVPPGNSCSNNEICGGGSFCSLPLKLCLCPDDMEDFEGQCRKPNRLTTSTAAGLDASCNDAVHCPNGTTCINGQCKCTAPLIQRSDQCVEELSIFRVGPGELCNGSQVCSRGSVCHPIIPVCICPENTVLQENSCFPVASGISNSIANTLTPPEAISNTTKVIQKFPAVSELNIESDRARQGTVGFPCRVNIECITGAFCKANTNPATCQCLSTHININDSCEKVLYPGQHGCHHDIQCSVTYAASKCSAGQCVCPDGFSAIEQTCKPETIEELTTLSTFNVPIDSLTSSTVSLQYIGDMLPATSINQLKTTETIISTINNSILATSIPARLPGQPRITGPPLRKPRPQTTTMLAYKTRPGNGICPNPDNVLRDESTNNLIVCNGEKPSCPPNSYCYITGYANQEYNCCRS